MNIIGIDIGGTSIKVGLVSDGKLIQTLSQTTVNDRIIESTTKAVDKLLAKVYLALSDIAGIGITLPGPVYQNNVDYFPNIRFESKDVYGSFLQAFPKTPIKLLNDANAAALGELSQLSEPVKDGLMITVGTGLGGGIISNYQLIEGAVGLGGEIGHFPLGSPYQLQCGCGKVDCAETLTSATGIRNLANLMKKPKETKVKKTSNVRQIFNYAKAGDTFANNVVEEWANYLAKVVHTINVITNPSVVILGGGVANAGDFLRQKVEAAYQSQAKSDAARQLTFQLATLGNDAGVVGAALAIRQELV